MRAFLLLALLFGAAQAFNQRAPLKPDPALTPGDVLTSDASVICQPGYTKTVRNVPSSLKAQVYRSYGILTREKGEYEVDHLISLELGGSNSIRNLWPESYKTQPLNARVKDALENKLHALACAGTISMQTAQQAIASDWVAAYVTYVGPLPGGVNAGGPPVPALPADSSTTVNPNRMGPSTPGAVQPNSDGSCPSGDPVKISRTGLYHLPQGDPNYQRTRAVMCYPDAASAQAAGFRGIK